MPATNDNDIESPTHHLNPKPAVRFTCDTIRNRTNRNPLAVDDDGAISQYAARLSGAAKLFLLLLDKHVADARIHFAFSGSELSVGREQSHTDLSIRVHRDRFFSRVLGYGNLGLGESYMDEDFEIVRGSLAEFLTVLLRNRLEEKLKRDPRLAWNVLTTRLVSGLRGKERNVQQHYDLGDDLFESFLDSTLTYSCGYVNSPSDTLEQLQFNKLDRICRKLRVRPGDRLLDIGCGFGSLLIHAAKHFGVTGAGITLSRRHCERAGQSIQAEGLSDQIRIIYQDFRSAEGTYDKVASVGMLEHVPRWEYKRYFAKIRSLLAPQGMGLVHAIGCNGPRNEHDPFIQKYIFPFSSQPKLSEITALLEGNRLAILDVENIVRHYAHTARAWLARFRDKTNGLDPLKYDARFRRMWEYYLACGIAAALASDSAVYQILFMRDHTAEIPLHRI